MLINRKGGIPLLTAALLLLFISNSYAFSGGGGHVNSGNYSNTAHNYYDNDQTRNDNVGYVDQTEFVPYAAPGTVENIYAPQEQVVVPPQTQHTSQTWISADNGQVPNGAIANTNDQTNSNAPTFYCRGNYNNQMLEGVLIPNDACYVQESQYGPSIRLNSYDVLVASSA